MGETTPADAPAANPDGIHATYTARLAEARGRHQHFTAREHAVSYLQLGLATLVVLWAVWLLRHWSRAGWLILLPIVAFIAFFTVQDRLAAAVRLWSRVVRFYERGLERLEGRWAGTGETGERFLDEAHPYARDLDLFGKGSLFELISTARTRAGEETLAGWLLHPLPVEEIGSRQAAVADVTSRLELRERLWALAEGFRAGVRPEHLTAWGEDKDIFEAKAVRAVAPVLAALWLISFLHWLYAFFASGPAFESSPSRSAYAILGVVTLVNVGLSLRYRVRVKQCELAIEDAGSDLKLLADVLAVFEQEPFTSPRLIELQSRLTRQGSAPSREIARLNRLFEHLESGHNLVVKPVDPVFFWNLQYVLAIEAWRKRFGPSIREWILALGELEAFLALGGYAYEHPEDVFPEFVAEGPYFHAEGIAHPLLPASQAVRNDLDLGEAAKVIILSGPNMAGKSTFLRALGANVVLAHCGAPVCARRLRLSGLAVAASICVLDSLQGGISRFYAEIRRLKQIVDLTEGPLPVFFLLDELLSGTNSHDRLIGTRSIVAKLMERGAVGLVTTHDLALAGIPESVGPAAVNCHFADQIVNDKLSFDYKLAPGVVETSNALLLMRSIGLEI